MDKNQKINLPNFIYLPMELYLNLNIPISAMRLFSMINLYQNNGNGCWASNNYLSKLASIDERSVTRNIAILEDWGYIIVKYKKSTSRRRIFINKYKEIYENSVEEVFNLINNNEKFDNKKQKEIFLNAKK